MPLLMRKVSDQHKFKGILQNIWPVLLKTTKIMKNKARLEHKIRRD